MKRLIVLMLLFTSTTSWATRARLISLGLDEDGTQILRDNRNIFLNPAEVNTANRGIYGEWGDNTLGNTNADAEGGLVYNFENFNLGLQLGRQTDVSDNISIANSFAGNTLIVPQNNVDLIFGKQLSESSIGFGLHYANTSSETTGVKDEARHIALSGGIINDKMGAYVRLDLIHEAEDSAANTEYDGNLQLALGGFFHIKEDSLIRAEIERTDFDARSTGNVRQKNQATSAELAVTHFIDTKGKSLVLFVDGGLRWADGEQSVPGTTTDVSVLSLPLTMGVEAPVKDWMNLRASVRQTVILDQQEVSPLETENIQSTVVAAGASFKLADFTIEGVLKGATSNGELDGDDIFSNVSMTYTF